MLCLQYTRSKDFNTKKFLYELGVALPGVSFELSFNPDTIHVCTFATLTEPDKAAVDGVVAAHDATDSETIEERPPAP